MLASVNAYCKINQLICYLICFFFSILSKRQALRIASAKNSASWWRYFHRITTTMYYKFKTVNTEITNMHYAKPISIVLRGVGSIGICKKTSFWTILLNVSMLHFIYKNIMKIPKKSILAVEDVLNLIYRLLRDRNIFWQCGKTVQQGHQSQQIH